MFVFNPAKISLHLSFLHGFWWKVCSNFYPFSSNTRVIFPLWFPWSLSFYVWFLCCLNVIYLGVGFFIFILFGVLWTSWISEWCLSLIWGNSQPLLFETFLLCSHFFGRILFSSFSSLFYWTPKSMLMVTTATKLKDACSLKEKLWPT